jgi:hypothetical protein
LGGPAASAVVPTSERESRDWQDEPYDGPFRTGSRPPAARRRRATCPSDTFVAGQSDHRRGRIFQRKRQCFGWAGGSVRRPLQCRRPPHGGVGPPVRRTLLFQVSGAKTGPHPPSQSRRRMGTSAATSCIQKARAPVPSNWGSCSGSDDPNNYAFLNRRKNIGTRPKPNRQSVVGSGTTVRFNWFSPVGDISKPNAGAGLAWL